MVAVAGMRVRDQDRVWVRAIAVEMAQWKCQRDLRRGGPGLNHALGGAVPGRPAWEGRTRVGEGRRPLCDGREDGRGAIQPLGAQRFAFHFTVRGNSHPE